MTNNLRGFYKEPNNWEYTKTVTKPVKKTSKKARNKANYQKKRLAVLKYFGLSDYATNVGVCLSIHKETGWEIPGKQNRYRAFITRFYNKGLKRKYQKPFVKKMTSEEFYSSKQWKELRYTVLSMSEGKCNLCGATAHDGEVLHVDHIKPRSKFPELSLDLDNLSCLCGSCNIGKSNYDDFDYRNKF